LSGHFFHACAVIFHFHLNVNSDHKNRSTNFLLREIKNESEKRFPALQKDSKESMHGNSAFGSIAFDNYARRNALGADLIAGPLAYRLRAPKRQRKSGHTGYVFVTGVGLKRPTRRWRDAQKPQIFLGSFGWLDEATGLKTGRLGFVGILGGSQPDSADDYPLRMDPRASRSLVPMGCRNTPSNRKTWSSSRACRPRVS